MKKSSVVLSFIIVMVAGAAFPGCLDVETKTKVNRDGSLTRSVTFKGDSGSVFGRNYPLTIDSLWRSSVRKVEEKKFEFSASRTFSTADELNQAIKSVPFKTLAVQVELDESFWWFVTNYHYKETYKRWSPFDNIPITDYISEAEIEMAIRHEVNDEPFGSKGDSLSLQDVGNRFEEWEARNIFESYFQVFLDGVRNLHDPSLEPERVLARKKDFFKAARDPIQRSKFDTLTVILDRLLKTRKTAKALAANKSGSELLDRQLNFKGAISSNTYKVNVEMPGIIIGTNARSIEGNAVHFEEFMQVAYFRDYEMWVTSRVINWWAVIVTAVMIVIGAVVLVVGKRRNGGTK